MPEKTQWTIHSILNWTTQYFSEQKISSPRLDAELLLAKVCGMSRLHLYLNADQPLTEEERNQYRSLVRKRSEGTPVAYLLNQKEFWSLELYVEPGVLIPRPDTEILVEKACQLIQVWKQNFPEQPCWIMELGTGSGAIPLALCSELEHLKIISFDISPIALETANKNINNHSHLLAPKNNEIFLVNGNKFESLTSQVPQFNFLISNPPYISQSTIPTLQKEVANFEPEEALNGGEDGLYYYRYFLNTAQKWLTSAGTILCEIGSDQKRGLEQLINAQTDFHLIDFYEDLQNHPRVVHIGVS